MLEKALTIVRISCWLGFFYLLNEDDENKDFVLKRHSGSGDMVVGHCRGHCLFAVVGFVMGKVTHFVDDQVTLVFKCSSSYPVLY